ncbi:MAG: murein biosynthesis integral membrane protein MurJ [Alphaproteobacteria bacterium]
MLRSLFTVSGWTGISRILGFLRDVLMAAVIGTGPIAEAFFVAFRLPNMFRRIFAEGAYAAAFVPLFSQELKQSKLEARDFANNAMAWLILVLLVLGGLALVFMPQLVDLLAGGFRADAEKFTLTVALARICFAYLLFMALTAHISSVLNAFGRFAAAAAAPVLLNVFFICALLAIVPFVSDTGHVLAWAAALAGVAQVVLVWWAAKRAGFDIKLVVPRATKGMGNLLKLMVPGTISAGVQQINLLVGTRLVSSLTGAVAFLSYADRVYQLPLGLIGIGLSIVLLPSLSRLISAGDQEAANNKLNRGIELCLLLSLPAGAALFLIPEQIVIVLFEHGMFERADALATAAALQAYAVGVPAFVLNKVMLPGFFARKDTKTPMYFAIASMVFFVALAFVFIGPYGFAGVALASSLASIFNVALLAVGLSVKGYWQFDGRLLKRSSSIVAASLGMSLVLMVLTSMLAGWFDETVGSTFGWQLLGLMTLVLAGGVSFFILAVLTKAVKKSDLKTLRS